MVPSQYHDFFVASAGVAGTLIGLLFVAVSVNPRWDDDDPDRQLEFAIRAGLAFVALSNTLVVALFALVPSTNLATPAIAASTVGLSSSLALAYMIVRAEGTVRRVWKLLLIGVQATTFLLQLVTAANLSTHPHSASDLQNLAILSVVFFLIGIHRAWELIGATETSLLHTLSVAIRERNAIRSATIRGDPAAPDIQDLPPEDR